MYLNNLKIALRKLLQRKVFTLINVTGLAIGLAGFGLIALYMYEEYSVDRYHTNADRLYRVTTDMQGTAVDEGSMSGVGRPLAAMIARDVPEVEDVIRIRRSSYAVKHNNEYHFDKVLFAGERLFTAFSFPVLKGSRSTMLSEPFAAVLKESVASRYFGNEDPVGKVLTVGDSINVTVTGIVADELNSHIDFDMVLSLATYEALGGTSTEWFTWDEYCYVLLRTNTNTASAEEKISALSMKYNSAEYSNNGYIVTHSLQPVPDIYLHSNMPGINKAAGNIKQLYILAGIAIFILILACVNFINLTTARQAERAKEIGVRKTIGASVGSLIWYFLLESFIIVMLASVAAVILITLLISPFNQLTGKDLSTNALLHPVAMIVAFGVILLTTVLSGWYPALILSSFKPAKTLKGNVYESRSGSGLRKTLVVFQFSISIILIICTIVSLRQLNHMQNQQLGFDNDRMLVIETRKTPRMELITQYSGIKTDLRSLSQVSSVTAAAGLPGRSGWEGQLVWAFGRPSEQSVTMEVIPVDHDYTQTLALRMVSGRGYQHSESDSRYGMLLNESAARLLGWTADEAVGKRIYTSGIDTGIVLGVMADFHQHGLQQKIKPLATFIAPYAYGYIAVKLSGNNLSEAVSQVQQYWKKRFPGYPFEYFFLDEDFNRQYLSEQRTANTFTVFAAIAIFIACLGLFGLATFLAEKRRKEVGIRKVLGASVASVTALLSKDFVRLVIIANLISWPVAWWAMNSWLQDFEYRINISWWTFILTALLSILIAFVTVSYQAIRAALANPAESIHTE